MIPTEPHHIIAIGASAGGMDEINSFFDHTPLDGVSYVIVQHLSPDFKSRMVELLSKHSKLVVREAENEMRVAKNEVYLIPNDKFMTISDGNLMLSDKGNAKGPHLTINAFFKSLATDFGAKAIAIVLSGLGSDGTEGIKAIKKNGGMVIVRNPLTSDFASMPSSAIATGLVDFVLEPALMPTAIEDYVKNEGELLTDGKDDEDNLKSIIELIKNNSALDFSDYKQSTILRRTKRRASYGNFTSLKSYLNYVRVTPDELTALSKEFLISVTSFFRDAAAFEFIKKDVLPDILKRLAPGEELKLWIAGCATGEEVYSLAIIIAELIEKRNSLDVVVKIFATDIDSAALIHAGKGAYNLSISKDVSPERLEKYFTKEAGNYRISPGIRKMVIFAQHNLVKNPPYCNMNFISCRNLLIYMTSVLQKKIFSMLLFGLKRDGYLFLGSSENPMPILKNLEVVNKKWKIYRNIEARRGVNFDAFALPELLDIKRTSSRSSVEANTVIAHSALSEAMHISLADDLDYLTICINENNQVISSYGDSTKYLLQKHFTSNLVELLPKPLAVVFNTLSSQAFKTGEKGHVKGIIIKQGKKIIKISMSVCPLVVKGEQKLVIVTLSKTKGAKADKGIIYDGTLYLDEYTRNLEEELKELKEKLHLSDEKLDASNENMQSFNEELISANEEMQSTNEEMQSVNEELHTINADYQLKNKELVEVNDDLNNYFRSNLNGQLFVNNDLELMRFSPGTTKQINLLETDIGRPLSNISTNIKFETIIDDVKTVLEDGNVITREIETNNGKWYQIMTMPYVQQASNKNSGAIITFNDITELKGSQQEISKKNNTLIRINADLDHFIHAASHDLLSPLSNIETSINIMNKISLTDKKLIDFLNIINSSIKKFRELITDIATIAKIESDMIVMEMVNLEEIMNNIEWSLEGKIKDERAVIIRNLKVKQVLFSKKNIRSILYNLISNAIKFRRDEPPLITIHTWLDGDNVILSVKDNGKGIPKGSVSKIFDMYGRLSQDIEGHGIGLYLAKKIVNAAGGIIEVESEPGSGSNFKIHLKTEAEKLSITPFLN